MRLLQSRYLTHGPGLFPVFLPGPCLARGGSLYLPWTYFLNLPSGLVQNATADDCDCWQPFIPHLFVEPQFFAVCLPRHRIQRNFLRTVLHRFDIGSSMNFSHFPATCLLLSQTIWLFESSWWAPCKFSAHLPFAPLTFCDVFCCTPVNRDPVTILKSSTSYFSHVLKVSIVTLACSTRINLWWSLQRSYNTVGSFSVNLVRIGGNVR